MNGVEELYGNLHVNNATEATSLNAATLQLVSGKLNLDGNTILATVNLAQLTTVGTLNYNALPALEQTGLTSGITSADEVIISDTGLTSLDGINVFKLKVFNVNNNADISSIDSGLQKVTDELSISYNAEKVDVSLDQLEEANDVYLQSINSLSVANLTKISNSLSLDSNALDTIEFKQLKSIGDSLSITKNSELEELDFPKLEKIGGALNINSNDNLNTLEGFPKLEAVSGTVNMSGTFDNGTFDSLKKVSGAFYFESDGDISCKEFKDVKVSGKESTSCATKSSSSKKSSSSTSRSSSTSGSSSNSNSDSNSGSSSSSSSDSSSSSNSGAASVAAKMVTTLAGVALVGLTVF